MTKTTLPPLLVYLVCGPKHSLGAGWTYAEIRSIQDYATAAIMDDRASAPNDGSWRQAIDEALIACALDCTSSHDDPKAALSKLIDWHVQVALDPAVSSAAQALIDADRAQRGEPVLWRYRDSEQVIRAMDGYTPVEGWTPLYTATQPAHTEAEVQEILDSSLREWRSVFEQTVRIILNVEKP